MKKQKETDFKLTVAVAVGLGVLGLGAAVRMIRETRQALREASRPRQSWDV